MLEMSVGDCFSFIQNGANIKQGEVDGGYPITRIETISNNRINRDRMGYAGITDITPYKAYVLEDGDILMSHINSVKYLGRAVKYSKHDDETIIHGMNLLRLKAIREIVIPDYACLYFSSRHFREQISRITKKSVNQASFSVADLKRAKMLIAPLEEQKQIVTLMSRIDGIMQTRETEFETLDQLIKARFVEMFGDPVSNPKGWPMPRIEEVVSADKNALKAGPFGSALKKEYYVESGYKIYGQEQVISGNPDYGDYYIDEERYHQLENCSVQAGDVLISLVGTYGKLLIMPQVFEPGIINPRLMKITFDKGKVNPYYFQHYFQSESLKKALADNTHGGTMDILNLGIVKNLREIPHNMQKQSHEFKSA